MPKLPDIEKLQNVVEKHYQLIKDFSGSKLFEAAYKDAEGELKEYFDEVREIFNIGDNHGLLTGDTKDPSRYSERLKAIRQAISSAVRSIKIKSR